MGPMSWTDPMKTWFPGSLTVSRRLLHQWPEKKKHKLLMRLHTVTTLASLWLCAAALVDAATTPTPAPTTASVCTAAQQLVLQSLWTTTAATSECKPFISKTANVSQPLDIVWSCDASSCTTLMGMLADNLPDCVVSGKTTSTKADVRAMVASCKTSANVAGGSSRSGTAVAGETTPAPVTTPMPTSTSTLTPTPTPSSSYSTLYCTKPETKTITTLFVNVATGVECRQYATVGGYTVTMFAPCTSRCVTTRYESLAVSVPDCYISSTSYELRNKKEQLMNALLNCSTANTSTAAEMSLYISLTTADPIDLSKSDASPSSSNLVKSSATTDREVGWTISVVIALGFVGVTIVQTMDLSQ